MKIALCQSIWMNDIEMGFNHVVKKTEEILKENQPDFFLLPEFFMGPPWFQPGQVHLKGVTDDVVPGRISDIFCNLAKKYKTNIIMGTMIEQREGKYYNTSLFINNEGKIQTKINKMHTFAGESVTCEASRSIEVIESNKGTVGIAVCSDFWIPELMKILVRKGAKMIFIPGGTLGQNVEPLIQALKTISYLTSTVIVYASPVGEIVGKRGDSEVRLTYTGNSMIVTPEGVLESGLYNKEDILTAEIDEHYIDFYREGSLCYNRFIHQNQEVMGDILSDYVGKEFDIDEQMKARMNFDDSKPVG